jgi:hypothetical protein
MGKDTTVLWWRLFHVEQVDGLGPLFHVKHGNAACFRTEGVSQSETCVG